MVADFKDSAEKNPVFFQETVISPLWCHIKTMQTFQHCRTWGEGSSCHQQCEVRETYPLLHTAGSPSVWWRKQRRKTALLTLLSCFISPTFIHTSQGNHTLSILTPSPGSAEAEQGFRNGRDIIWIIAPSRLVCFTTKNKFYWEFK